jgi:hypothetical protein
MFSNSIVESLIQKFHSTLEKLRFTKWPNYVNKEAHFDHRSCNRLKQLLNLEI